MKGKWKISSNYAGDTKVYHVYRLRDVDAIDHSGNRECVPNSYTEDKQKALKMAAEMNAKERKGENHERISN